MLGSTILKTTASIAAVVGALTVSATAAHADTYVPLFTQIHQHSGSQPSLTQAANFGTIIGLANQNIGYPERYWTYVKGTRSSVSTFPESWYVHVNGVRAKDYVYNLFVMNPNSAGWQQHVADICPHYCYLDGMGISSLARTRPRMAWTNTQWVKAAASEVRHVVSTGDRALPNSISNVPKLARPFLDAAGQGSTELFTGLKTRAIIKAGRIWVSEKDRCGKKLAAYLLVKGRGDHFACYDSGSLPWSIPSTSRGTPLGKAQGKAYKVRTGLRRNFAHGHVLVHSDGTYRITTRR